MNLTTEQTTLEDFDPCVCVERVLPRFVRACTEGIEDNIAELYTRMTDEDRDDSILTLRDTMTDAELQVLDSFSYLEDEIDFRDSGLVEQESVAGALKWRVIWECVSE